MVLACQVVMVLVCHVVMVLVCQAVMVIVCCGPSLSKFSFSYSVKLTWVDMGPVVMVLDKGKKYILIPKFQDSSRAKESLKQNVHILWHQYFSHWNFV